MRATLTIFVAAIAIVAIARPARANTLFVDKGSTAAAEDGSAAAPFHTITRALERARELRFGAASRPGPQANATIVIHVAPSATPYVGSFNPLSTDPTKERLPLLLNVPKLKLVGETVLEVGPDGLPAAVVPGTETTLRSDVPQGSKQYLILVTRTAALPGSGFAAGTEMIGDEVTVSGLVVQAETGRVLPSPLIAVDGVLDFVASGNALLNGGNGLWTRLASGRIEGNLFSGNIVGLYLTAGSVHFPARIAVVGNRIDAAGGGGITGIGLLGGGETGNRRVGLDLGGNRFKHLAPPAQFDRVAAPDEVPDLLRAEVVGNVVVGYQLGFRPAGYLQDPYRLVEGQDESARVNAAFRGNSALASSYYGLVVDASQIALGDRRSIHMQLSFESTTLEGVVAPAVLSFWRFAGSFELAGVPIPFTQPEVFSLPNPVFARDSSIEVCGDVTQFQYDNRQDPNTATNPPPLDNVMTVNGVALVGRWPDSAADVGGEMPVVIAPSAADCAAP